MDDNGMLLITKFAFTFAYSVHYALILGAAKIWYPYSPTFTSYYGKWVGWRDIYRWLLSGVLLFFAPILYLVFVLVGLSQVPPPIAIPSHVPTVAEFLKCVLLLSLALPALGLYDFWQVIMRRWPRTFYSEEARNSIRQHYKSAFTAGKKATLLLACIWFFVPTICFVMLLRQ